MFFLSGILIFVVDIDARPNWINPKNVLDVTIMYYTFITYQHSICRTL